MSGFEDDNYDIVNNDNRDTGSHRTAPTITSSRPFDSEIHAIYTSPLRSEISTVLVALRNLYNTASFVSTLGGESISHAQHVKLLGPINDLLGEVNSLDQALQSMEERSDYTYSSCVNDVVYDKDLLFKWTSDCNTCILGFQTKLEEEAQRLTDWMERQNHKPNVKVSQEEEDEDDEWTVLDTDESGDVHSVSLREKKQADSLKENTGENSQTETFKADPDWELESYAQQLTMTMHDLGTCVPFVRRFAPTTWTRHGRRGRGNQRTQNQGEGLSWYPAGLDV